MDVGFLGERIPQHNCCGDGIVRPTRDGLRAVSKSEIAKPESVARYLAGKFGDQFEPARAAMMRLATSLPADELNEQAFHLYGKRHAEAVLLTAG